MQQAIAALENSRMPFAYRVIVSAFVVCLLLGCSDGGPTNRRPTKKVTVKVTYKGSPLENANVTFINQDGEPAPAYGKTDAQGVAKMKTYVEGDGAVPGMHKVLIDKSESVGGQTVDVDSPQYNPNAPPPTVKYLIPQKFNNPGTSGLTAEVKDGPNEFTFDLKD
jgi:hypothetical protein